MCRELLTLDTRPITLRIRPGPGSVVNRDNRLQGPEATVSDARRDGRISTGKSLAAVLAVLLSVTGFGQGGDARMAQRLSGSIPASVRCWRRGSAVNDPGKSVLGPRDPPSPSVVTVWPSPSWSARIRSSIRFDRRGADRVPADSLGKDPNKHD